MGIRMSYWATGGILALLGLAVARLVLPLLAGLALALGALVVKAMFFFALILVAWLAFRLVRGRRRAAEG